MDVLELPGHAAGRIASAASGSIPAEVWLRDERIIGAVFVRSRRLSDLLRTEPMLQLHDPISLPSTSVGVVPSAPRHAADHPVPRLVAAEEILAVVLRDRGVPSPRRRHRRQARALLRVGPLRAEGTVHVVPGVDPATLGQPGTLRRFLPLTDAVVIHAADPEHEEPVPVLIVNLRRVTQLEVV
jgi:hypothetical protein